MMRKQMIMINCGKNESLISIVGSLQCLESTEGGESDTELEHCNLHKRQTVVFPL